MPSAAIVRPTLLAAAGSHAGLQRDNNEDRFHCDAQRGIFMVIDGVGGQAAGEKAAETALTMIRARLERETGHPAERVREAITLANNEIFRLAATEPSWAGMACVLTVALVRDGTVTVGHVGDTRLYAFTRGSIAKVTHDHSPVGEREDRGDLDELEAMRHPRRNEIYRDVGSQHHEPGDAEFIETLELPFEADSGLVLCSDGLSDLVPSARVARIVSEDAADPPRVVERLIEAANAAGGRDNVTAVVVLGPGFAETAKRALRAAPRDGASSGGAGSASVAGGLRAALSSRAAMFAYGLVAGLAVAAALLVLTDALPDRLLQVSRPAGWNRTWHVGPGEYYDFATIQEALDRAGPGDLVEVDNGTYQLPIVIPPGVNVAARKSREAVLQPPDGGLPRQTPGITVSGRSRVAGFKIDVTGLADGILVQDDEAELDDLEVTGAANAAVVFGARSRGVLRASYLHDNPGVAIGVDGQAMPRLLHNVVAHNGRPGTPAAGRPLEPNGPRGSPAIVLQPGASAVFFGNIVAGNADDQIVGLAAEKRADVLRDNVIGLQPPPRLPTPVRPRNAPPPR